MCVFVCVCDPVYIGAEVGDEGKPWSHTIIGLILSTQCAQVHNCCCPYIKRVGWDLARMDC